MYRWTERPSWAILCFAAVAYARTANAQQSPSGTYYELRADLPRDLSIAAAAGVLWLGAEVLRPQWASAHCRWCDRNADGTDGLNALDATVRSGLRWSSVTAADVTSNILAWGLGPGATLGLNALAAYHDGGTWSTIGTDAILILEAATIASVLNEGVKFAAARERPFVHVLPPDEKSRTDSPSDNNLSFFSGHTTWVFALATASGTVASLRGYRAAPFVWAVGMPLAAATGYLRIAADKHYFSDVLVGAAAGMALGAAVPLLFHARTSSEPALGIAAIPNGFYLQYSGAL